MLDPRRTLPHHGKYQSTQDLAPAEIPLDRHAIRALPQGVPVAISAAFISQLPAIMRQPRCPALPPAYGTGIREAGDEVEASRGLWGRRPRDSSESSGANSCRPEAAGEFSRIPPSGVARS